MSFIDSINYRRAKVGRASIGKNSSNSSGSNRRDTLQTNKSSSISLTRLTPIQLPLIDPNGIRWTNSYLFGWWPSTASSEAGISSKSRLIFFLFSFKTSRNFQIYLEFHSVCLRLNGSSWPNHT